MKNYWCTAVILSGLAITAQAQTTIFSDNLDSKTSGSTTPGYTFGDVTNFSHTYQAGAGVSGSIGAVISSGFTNAGVGFGGVAYQYQNGNVGGLNTHPGPADYTLSFDAEVNKANGGFTLIAQTWPSASFGGTVTSSTYTPDIRLATPNVFQHFSVNLGTTNWSAGLVPTGQTWQIAFQMNEGDYGGPGTGNQLVIDNVVLTMIPEPSSLALCAVGAMVALARRRRS
jgi:hypothetical protein